MKRHWVFMFAACLVAAAPAAAQESENAAGRFELAGAPGGGLFFTDSADTGEPGFGSYAFGGSFTFNFHRYWAVEGDVGVGVGIEQRLTPASRTLEIAAPPHMLGYNGALAFYPWTNGRGFAPYVLGGLGGLTLFSRDQVGVDGNRTYLTGNGGAGAKWYLGRWGLRGEYRFFAVDPQEDAPAFFGSGDPRYAHRVTGSVLLNFSR